MNIFYTSNTYNRNHNFIDKLRNDLGLDLRPLVEQYRPIDPVIIDIGEIDSTNLKERTLVIVCYKSDGLKNKVKLVKERFGDCLLGFLNCDDKVSSYKGLFDGIIHKTEQFPIEETISLTDLKSLYDESLNELERVKKLHKKVVSVRKEKFKNISLYSKFIPGIKSGGEFFDMVKCGHVIVIALGSFQSYLGASVLMKNLHELGLKNVISKSELEDFLEEFINDCREIDIIDKDDYSILQLDILCFNMSNLELNIYQFGASSYLINNEDFLGGNQLIVNENNFTSARMSLKLKRNDRIVFLSPGFKLNLKKANVKVESIKESLFELAPEDSLHEAMFHIKKDVKESFLEKDASVLIFEVNNHALVKV